MKAFKYICVGLFVTIILYACQKGNLATDYKDFLHGRENIYTGVVSKVIVQPGNLQIGLKWKASTDPSITKYVVYYNNKADSQIVNVSGRPDTIRTTIKGLAEYSYSFTIRSFDAKGNSSIPFEVNNAKVYGPIYSRNLINRGYDVSNPYELNSNGTLKLNFVKPDTINTKTMISYTNAAGKASTAILLAKDESIVLPSYKLQTEISYKSYYIPERTAIDTFEVANATMFPTVYSYLECDKSLFSAVSLPFDVFAEFDTSFGKLWDGSVGPKAYPEIFHSNLSTLPHHFTFDLGKVYSNLVRMEETGRTVEHNPLNFEVWGIDDLSGANITVPGTDAGWATQMTAKGWTLLKDCVRTDDGVSPMRFELNSNPPPVRYIRIRVKSTFSGQNYSNISEITFWNKE
ncbi:DUF4998 domain-containing protein [Pedobacter nyackensis]|uniref:DUF4998 domain-containing protein n=1 Tax=Pedobacter nyackensis TaxID=475255 RepID=UPI00292F6A20|nr:DUF4998 domain-containing protein [Pedobacter nyackensis]